MSRCVSHGHEKHCHSLPYDHLVLALGSATNFSEIPGRANRAFTMKSLGDAMHYATISLPIWERPTFSLAHRSARAY